MQTVTTSLPDNSTTRSLERQYPAYPDGRPDNVQVRQAYADHLQEYPWDFYLTVTSRKPRTHALNFSQGLWHSLHVLDATRAFIAVENNYLGGIHIHALSRHCFRPGLRSQSVWKYVWKAYGRSTVEEITDAAAVSSYCAKYVLKGQYDYDFYGDAAAWQLDDLTNHLAL